MITKIFLETIPFESSSQTLDVLKMFNYFFGANGSGKTTISKVIAAPEFYPDCNITWENGIPLETRVYNRDFIERNFNPQNKLKGVFTLGEMEAETLAEIESAKADIINLKETISSLELTLQGEDGNGGKSADSRKLKLSYKDKFWIQKQKHSDKLGGGLAGYLSDSAKFMDKVILEAEINKATLLPLADLEEKAATIFSKELVPAICITELNIADILEHEKNPILQKRIIGKEDVDIAAMIRKLGNSDWVRQGLTYYRRNNELCPFCQQKITHDFEKSLVEYFDESFLNDTTAVSKLTNEYASDAIIVQNQIQELIDKQSEFIDSKNLKSQKQLLDSIIAVNNQRLSQKQKEASQEISLDSLEDVLRNITAIIKDANKAIQERNDIIKNLKTERATLTSHIWKFIVNELDQDIADYNRQQKALDAAINNLASQIKTKETEKTAIKRKLHDLEKQTTTITTTCYEINHILNAFGFKNFSLAIGDDEKTYKLVRENGTEAQHTLSEGEKNFVTFLYFYHLLKGSQNETGLTNDKIVVFDDPISSLDNDVLFIVSALIRELIQDIRNNIGSIKQVFVLTHNIYFYKEVTYNHRRNKDGILSEETFWIVKKDGKNSKVESQSSNPIKTSYELLWDEIKKKPHNNATIQNTMRRILESYFKLLGNIPLENLYKQFDGHDKVMCKALCSWINDGSHSTFDDDFYTPIDDAMVTKYLSVFRQIFEKSKQISHYNMMMGVPEELGIL